MRALVVGVLVVGACGSHGAAGTSDAANPADVAAIADGAAPDGAASWSWQSLVAESWTAPAPSYNLNCAQIPITQEMWIDGFRPAAGMGAGNDHQIALVTQVATPDGDCSSRPLEDGDQLIYASGLGSNEELRLPAGTAVHLVPGTAAQPNYVMLYSHVSNETGATLTGTSGVDVHVVADPTTVAHDVDMILGGQAAFNVPDDDAAHVVPALCSPAAAAGYQWHLVAVWPHMHESGTHATITIEDASLTPITTVLDTDYSYANEQFYPANDALVDTGDTIAFQFTMQNAGAKALTYNELLPESVGYTLDWAGIYKYPTGDDASSGAHGPEACVRGL